MSQRETINALLEDMDTIRPLLIAAHPEDQELRTITLRMISELESLKRSPSVPAETYLWLSRMTSKFMDTEHGTLLKSNASGVIPNASKQSIQEHIQRRRQLLIQALQEIPTANSLLDKSSELIGKKARKEETLHGRARHMLQLLRNHLEQDVIVRKELQQLIDAFKPSVEAISSILEQAGEDSPELKLAQQLLEQNLPDDTDEAKAVLQDARKSILKAGNKLVSASEKLNQTIQENIEQLSSLSSRLEQAESEARNDPLTGLANRRHLAEYLSSLTESYCFLIVDIDYFKKINDEHGHDVGDEILARLGAILKESVRNTDLAARVGGEEFCIVLPETSLENSRKLAETLRQSIELHPFSTQHGAIDVTVSLGIAEHHEGMSNSETFKAADKALYQSKHRGRNRVTVAAA